MLENSSAPMGAYLKDTYAEIETSVRISVFPSTFLVEAGSQRFDEENIFIVDPSFLSLFSFPLIEGSAGEALNRPDAIVLTSAMATKYFGDTDPIGQTVMLDQKHSCTVTGIIENPPRQSTIQFNMLLPFSFCETLGRDLTNWGRYYYHTYVGIAAGTDVNTLQTKMDTHIEAMSEGRSSVTLFQLTPLLSRHLYNLDGTLGKMEQVRIMMLVAALICLIASVNFINLSTARASRRSMEIGIRKTFGAGRNRLIRQFLSESILMTFCASAIVVLLTLLLLPWMNHIAGRPLQEALFTAPWIIPLLIGLVLSLGLIGGGYPAWMMANMDQCNDLRSRSRSSSGNQRLRHILVLTQFAMTGGLLIATWVMSDQLTFMQNKELGLKKEALVYVPIREGMQNSFRRIRELALDHTGIVSATATSSLPTKYDISSGGFNWQGRDPEASHSFYLASADYDFVSTFNMELTAGRDYSMNYVSDSTRSMLINESAAAVLGFDDPVGQTISYAVPRFGGPFTIIGVVKDYHFASLEKPIKPLLLPFFEEWHSHLFFRIVPERLDDALEHIQKCYEVVDKAHPFELQFLDADYEVLYRDHFRLRRLLQTFSGLALVVSCLGLLGLAAYAAQQRVKEIGIRKVLGASTGSLIVLFLSDLLKGVVVAFVIVGPVTLYLMRFWLENFTYRITPHWTLAVWAAAIGISGAVLAAGTVILRATIVNPAEILHDQ
ncbi:ABC transporter permease [bacterium]|nr:ABC transporter permease [bacterium]